MWIHTRDIVILFSRFTKYIYILWIWNLLQFMTTEFKLWLEIDSASLCLWRVVHSWEAQERNAPLGITAPFHFSHHFGVAQKSLRGRLVLFMFCLLQRGSSSSPHQEGRRQWLLSHISIAFTYTLVQCINTHTCPALVILWKGRECFAPLSSWMQP